MYKIAILSGDGIGPEIMREAVKVMDVSAEKYHLKFKYDYQLVGGALIDKEGLPISEKLISICKDSDAVLFGAVGGPKWDDFDSDKRPEKAIIQLRKELSCYVNLRVYRGYACLSDVSPLRPRIFNQGIDFVIVRELSSGAYYGEPKFRDRTEGHQRAVDTIDYHESEIRRLARFGFKLARTREKRLTSMCKWNVMESSRLWRDMVDDVAKEYPDVKLTHEIIDTGSMNLILKPYNYDVIIMSNMYGDILGDMCAAIIGSLGLIPSAAMGMTKGAIYEPIHGSANDIENQGIANPLGTILSAALMMKYSLQLPQAAVDIENAVEDVLDAGYRTTDIFSEGFKKVSTLEMGDRVAELI